MFPIYVCVTRQTQRAGDSPEFMSTKLRRHVCWPSNSEVGLGTVVKDKHEGAAHAARDICHETLVQASRQALLCGDLLKAISRTLVEVLLRGFLRLHLQSPSHGVKGVCGSSANCDRSLSCGKRSHCPKNALVTLVRVEASDY